MVSEDDCWVVQPRRRDGRLVYEVKHDGWVRRYVDDVDQLREYLAAHGVDLADLKER